VSPAEPSHRSPSPVPQRHSDNDDEDAEGESDDDGGLEIEVPDARPPRRGHGALVSLGLGSNLGVGGSMRSPSNGPISLASATNSAHGSPNLNALGSRRNAHARDEIDFDEDMDDEDAEGEEEEEEDYNNRDVDDLVLGPPARQGTSGHDRKTSTVGAAGDDDEDDLEKLMMEGFAGDSSEESEEE
jgi:hypothetical protein